MWLLVLVCVVLFVVKTIVDWKQDKLKQYPPGPRGLPIIGNLLLLNRLVRETGFHFCAWAKLAEQYGSVLKIRLGLAEPLVVVSGREAILDFLGRKEFDGRPDTFEIRHRCVGKKRGIVLNDGRDWVEQKKFLLKVLKEFGFGKQTMENLVLEDAKMLCDIVGEKMLDKKTSVHDFCEVTAIAVVSSLWNLIAGRRCDPTKAETQDMLEILRILKESFRNGSATGALWQHIPFLRYIMPKYSGFADQEQRVSTMSNYFLDEVARHKKTKVYGEPRDLIDKYLDEIESVNNNNGVSSFDELQLVVLLKDIFSAGIETTSNTIGFTIAYLAKHPDSQKKIHQELDQVIGKHGTVRLAQKTSLPYLTATIAEITRLANVAPTTVVHRALVDAKLRGYKVKKNWSVIGNLRSVHMDSDHWADAPAFRPERFLDAAGNFAEDPWLMPFGAGRRKCLGENLAKTSLFLFLALLLQKFRFCLAPGESASCLLGVNGFTVSPPHINILIKSRCYDDRDKAA